MDAANGMTMSVCSFDIFDTVLTRRLSCPVDVFSLLESRLREEGIWTAPFGKFRELRIRCERWSRRLEPSYEVLLPDIYDLLGKFLFWTEKQRRRAAEIEKEIESEFLCATPFGLAAVQHARDQGRTVGFVSDMYLDSPFLKGILVREGLAQADDLVAVSGEWKASKAGKEIWPHLLKKWRIAPEQLLHQGDHEHSDVDSPAAFGIAARRLGTSVVSRWEQWRAGSSPLPVEEWGGIAAVSRITRASCQEPDDYWMQLGTGLLGPLLVGFATWVLEQAKRDGSETLWFLSRDGWLFYEAAKRLNRDASLRLQYVGLNRLHMRHALEGPVPLESLFSGSRAITWTLVAERLCLSAEELLELQKSAGCESVHQERLSADVRQSVLRILHEPAWRECCARKVRQAGQQAEAYVRQRLSEVNGALGLIDIGWAGRTQDGLETLCPQLQQGYYLGLSRSASAGNRKKAWLYDQRTGEGACSLDDFQRMIEVLFGGVSGPLLGYEMRDKQWHPQFADAEHGEKAPGRERMQQAALAFVEQCRDPAYADWWTHEQMQSFACWNLQELLERPTHRDANEFLHWHITTDDAHQDTIQPAKGFDRPRIVACLRGREAWGWVWPQASLKNTESICAGAMKAAWFLRRIRQ